MKIEFIGLTERKQNNNNPWLCFEYRVTIGKETTEYFTGIGHAYVSSKKEKPEDFPANWQDGTKYTILKHNKQFERQLDKFSKTLYIRKPSPSDIAECLLSDIQCGQYSFDEFCENLGYSNDSLKALDVYRACMELARKFKKSDLIGYLTEEQKELYA